MDFNRSFNRAALIAASAWTALTLAACAGGDPVSTTKDEENIGQPLETVTPVVGNDGNETQAIAIFDATTKGVHRFDVDNMTHLGFNYVSDPDQKHFVLTHPQGNYVIDLTWKHMTIFTKDGYSFKDPIRFQGTPKSAAFFPGQGYLAVYDTMSNVSLLKLNSEGVVVKKAAKGSLVSGATIKAGDMDNQGRLILALSNGTVAVADVEASLDDPNGWVFLGGAPAATGISDINWVAPIFGTTRVLVRSASTLGLWDYMARTMIATKSLSGLTTAKLSKAHDPHVLVTGGSSTDKTKTLIYADGNVLAERVISQTPHMILTSVLNLGINRWQIVGTDVQRNYGWWNDVNFVKTDRRLRAYRFSDMLAIQDLPLDNRGEACLANSYLFTLMPSELGFALRQNVEDGTAITLRKFNQPYIK